MRRFLNHAARGTVTLRDCPRNFVRALRGQSRSVTVPLLLCLLAAAAQAAGPYVSEGFIAIPSSVRLGAMSAVDVAPDGSIYILHRGEPPVLAFDKKGMLRRGFGDGMFQVAHGLRVDRNGDVWTTDNGRHVLRKFSPDGRLLATYGLEATPGAGKTLFRSPDDLVFASNGDIYVADAGNGRVVHLKSDGSYVSEWGKKGKGESEFAAAHGIAIDSSDRIYVADRGNNRIQVFRPKAISSPPGRASEILSGRSSWTMSCSSATATRTRSAICA